MSFIVEYFRNIYLAVRSLLTGMRITGYYFLKPGTSMVRQYPEIKPNLVLPERFRGEVIMTHNENNEHRCTGCSACEIACPNGTIKILNAFDIDEKGKKKKRIDQFVYYLSMCTFCNLCVDACPTGAITMGQDFEHSVTDRSKLTKVLNKPGSKVVKDIE
jgi:NADH-quinone oxidoreductase subunit I